jgi:tol-pal system protein YbgF
MPDMNYLNPLVLSARWSRPGRLVLLLLAVMVCAIQTARAESSTSHFVHDDATVMNDTPIILAQTEPSQAASRSDARAMVQLMNQLDSLNVELNKLRGKVEELNNSVLNAEKRQKDMYLDLDTRLRRIEKSNTDVITEVGKSTDAMSDLRGRIEKLEQAAAAGASPASAAANGTAPATGGGSDANDVVTRAYEAAMARYRAGEYQDAIQAFQAIVEQYPGHPLAANALYWTGDSFYQLRAYRSAIDAQKKLIATYPNSRKTADAMLNMGSALVGLGEIDGARQTWERLIATYPGSRAAANAGERIKRLP